MTEYVFPVCGEVPLDAAGAAVPALRDGPALRDAEARAEAGEQG